MRGHSRRLSDEMRQSATVLSADYLYNETRKEGLCEEFSEDAVRRYSLDFPVSIAESVRFPVTDRQLSAVPIFLTHRCPRGWTKGRAQETRRTERGQEPLSARGCGRVPAYTRAVRGQANGGVELGSRRQKATKY